ncbi:hypothetical protein PLESTF_000532000 [Pleodorina starrii]|nr:hypothetical protein PLESTF_000532000 [Pleodorina starrii]
MCLSALWHKFCKKNGSVPHGQAKAPRADLETDDRGRRHPVVQLQAAPAPEVSSSRPQETPYTLPINERPDAKALRDGLIMEASTSIITVFAVQDGSILFQNHRSRAYYGDRLQGSHAASAVTGAAAAAAAAATAAAAAGAPSVSFLAASASSSAVVVATAPPISAAVEGEHRCREYTAGALDVASGAAALAGSALAQLFALEPQKLLRLLEVLAAAAGKDGAGRVWKGVLRVPPHLVISDYEASAVEGAPEVGEAAEAPASRASVPVSANSGAADGALLVDEDGGAPGRWAQGGCADQPPAPARPRRLQSPLEFSQDRWPAQQQQWGSPVSLGCRSSVSHHPAETLVEVAQLCDDATHSSRCESMAVMVTEAPPSGAGAGAAAAAGSTSGPCRPACYSPRRPQSYDLPSPMLSPAPYGAVQGRPHSGAQSYRAVRSHTCSRGISATASLAVRNAAAAAASETPRLAPAAAAVSAAADAAMMAFQPFCPRSPFLSTDTLGAAAPSMYGSAGGSATPLDGAAAVTAEHLEEALSAGSGPLATSVLALALSENPSLARTLSIGHPYNPYSSTQYGKLSYMRSPAGSATGLQRLSATAVLAGGLGSPAAATAGTETATAAAVALAAAPASHAGGVAQGEGLLRPPGLQSPPPPPPLPQQQQQKQQGELDTSDDECFARQLPRVAAPAARLLGRREGSCSWPRCPDSFGSGVSGDCTSLSLAGSDGIVGAARLGSGPSRLGSGPAGIGSGPRRRASLECRPAGFESGTAGPGFESVGFGSRPAGPGSGPARLGSGPAGLGSGPAGLGYVLAAGAAASASDACCSAQLTSEPMQPSNFSHSNTPTLQQRCSRLASGSHGRLAPQGGSRPAWCSQASSNGGRTTACSFLDERTAGTLAGDVTPSWLFSAAASDCASTAPLSAHVLPYICRSTSTERMIAAACGGAGSRGGPAAPMMSKMVPGAAAAAAVGVALQSAASADLALSSPVLRTLPNEAPAAEPGRGHQDGHTPWQLGPTTPPRPSTSLPLSAAPSAAGAPSLVVQFQASAAQQATEQAGDAAPVFPWSLPPLGGISDAAVAAAVVAIKAGAADAGTRPAPPQPDGAVETMDDSLSASWRRQRILHLSPPVVAAGDVRELRNKDGPDVAPAPHSSVTAAADTAAAAAAGQGLHYCGGDGVPGSSSSPAAAIPIDDGKAVQAAAHTCESPGRSNEALQKLPTYVSDETEWGMVATFRQSALVCAARSQGQVPGLGSGSGGGGGGSSDLEGRDSPDAVSLHVALKNAAAAASGSAANTAAAVKDTAAATAVATAAAATGAEAARIGIAAAVVHPSENPEELGPSTHQQQQGQRQAQDSPSEGREAAPQQYPGMTVREPSRWAARAPVVPPPRRPPLPRPPARGPCLLARGPEAGLESSLPSGLLDRSRSLPPVPGCCWHRVIATPAVDPVTGRSVIVVMQDDVTGKVQLERRLGLMQETEHRLLEQLYPRHMLAHLADEVVTVQRQEQQQLQQQLQQLQRRQQSSRGHGGCGDADAGVGGVMRAASQCAAAAAAGATTWGSRRASLERSTGQLQRLPLGCCSNAGAGGATGTSSCSLSLPSLRLSAPLHDHSYTMATLHPQVTLLFADIKGFTPLCNKIQPREVMAMLNELFCRFDSLLDKYHVRKVETIGDAYFVAGGLTFSDALDSDGGAHCDGGATRSGRARSLNAASAASCGSPAAPAAAAAEDSSSTAHALNVIGFAKAMLAASQHVATPTTGEPVEIRVGLHTGPVVSGLLGSRMPRFCLFGSAVAVAARMETTGVAGAVQISETTYRLLPVEDRAGWEATPGVEVRGVGKMQTYLWRGAAVLGDGRKRSGDAR